MTVRRRMTAKRLGRRAALVCAMLAAACGCSALGDAVPEDPRTSSADEQAFSEPPPTEPLDTPPQQAPVAPAVTLPAPETVDEHTPQAVALAAAVTFNTYDTAVDASVRDAAIRAAPYLTAEELAVIRSGTPRPRLTDPWAELASHRGYTTAAADVLPPEAGQPKDDLLTTYLVVRVTVVGHGRDGWQANPAVNTVHMRLARVAPGDAWKIAWFTES